MVITGVLIKNRGDFSVAGSLQLIRPREPIKNQQMKLFLKKFFTLLSQPQS